MTSSARDTSQTQPLADKTARESVIRDLYALVAFYVANPEFPLPDSVTAHTVVTLEQCEAIAAERGGKIYGGFPQTHFDLEGTSRPITIMACVAREDRPL